MQICLTEDFVSSCLISAVKPHPPPHRSRDLCVSENAKETGPPPPPPPQDTQKERKSSDYNKPNPKQLRVLPI